MTLWSQCWSFSRPRRRQMRGMGVALLLLSLHAEGSYCLRDWRRCSPGSRLRSITMCLEERRQWVPMCVTPHAMSRGLLHERSSLRSWLRTLSDWRVPCSLSSFSIVRSTADVLLLLHCRRTSAGRAPSPTASTSSRVLITSRLAHVPTHTSKSVVTLASSMPIAAPCWTTSPPSSASIGMCPSGCWLRRPPRASRLLMLPMSSSTYCPCSSPRHSHPTLRRGTGRPT
mmetsp:Transcript_36778/g.73292  ORF Transcript_36778/g.73292 Transcript_36778/m.73292 type:complete len:228 (+) Transcript_36778:30-713(+)